MSDNETIPQDQEAAEEELPVDGGSSVDPSDTGAAPTAGDPPIIVQGGGSGTPS
jgi:hypothetical protein